MTHLAYSIAQALSELGIQPGDTLLVHSSLKSLGVPGATPADVIDGLMAAVTEKGTLMLPTLSYLYCGADAPEFDVNTTPACVGAIPEYFRKMPGVVRSLCPTHSCASIGPLADYLTRAHHMDGTPCGPNSPFARLRDVGGRVLFLGCGCSCNTSMHAVEELVVPPYLFGPPVDYRVTTASGEVIPLRCMSHNFSNVRQQYRRVPDLMEQGVQKGMVCGAACVLLDAVPMWEAAHSALKQDPYALVEHAD